MDWHNKLKLIKPLDKHWGVQGVMSWELFHALMDLPLNGFQQSGQPGSWCFVEFWSRDEERILDLVLELIPDVEVV